MLALHAVGCATTPDGESGVYTPLPGTRVSVAVPYGYATSDAFAGFADEHGASLLVTEWSRSEAAMLEELASGGFAERGMAVVGEEQVEIDGRARRLFHVSQERPGGGPVARRILVVGDAASTSILTATAPQDVFPADLEAALRSARRDARREVAPFEGLGFELDETDALAVSARIAEVVHMRAPGTPVPPGPAQPQLIAGRAELPAAAELASFARQRLSLTPGIDALDVVGNRSLEVDGLPGYELVARARDRRSRDRITLLQLIAVDESRYFLVQGRVASTQADRYLPEFRKVAASLRRTD